MIIWRVYLRIVAMQLVISTGLTDIGSTPLITINGQPGLL